MNIDIGIKCSKYAASVLVNETFLKYALSIVVIVATSKLLQSACINKETQCH